MSHRNTRQHGTGTYLLTEQVVPPTLVTERLASTVRPGRRRKSKFSDGKRARNGFFLLEGIRSVSVHLSSGCTESGDHVREQRRPTTGVLPPNKAERPGEELASVPSRSCCTFPEVVQD